ncbi:MAG: thioredoxin family protein [Prevotella sp.]|nr:thioredoxin family protein [Prevotella sp.]
MKKSLLLSVLMAIAVMAAYAQGSKAPRASQPLNPSTSQPFTPSTSQLLNPSTSQPLNPSTSQPFNFSTFQLFNPSTPTPPLPSFGEVRKGSPSAITEQPAGTVHDNLYRFSASYEASSLGKGVFSISDGVVSTIVEGDDGYLYLKDPFSRFAYGSWIKGRIEGDTVTFEFPQFMYSEQSGGFTLDCYVSRMILSDDASTFVLDPDRQDMKFIWKDGRLTQAEDDPVMGMSTWVPELGNMWFWVGYADYNIRIEPLNTQPTELPEGLQTETYVLNFWPDDETQDYRMVNIGFDGQDVYANNLSNTNADSWVRGVYDGDIMRFFSGTYLGVSERMNAYDPDQHIFVMAAREVKTYAESGAYQSSYYPVSHIDFTRQDTPAPLFSSDSVLASNAGRQFIFAEAIFRQPSLEKFSETAGTPTDPTILWVSEYSPSSGYGLMSISMPKVTTTGQRMNLNKLFYRIYLDDEVMTFNPDEYWYVGEPTIEMPYGHVDKRDFTIDVDQHRVFYYQAGVDRIGVQMVYRGAGEEHHSNIVYYDIATGESTTGTGDGTTVRWGTTKAESYDVAIKLDGDMYEGKTIERIRIPLEETAHVSNLKAFLTTELALEDTDGAARNKPNVATYDATPVAPANGESYGWAEIVLPEPYTITNEGVYVGYSLDIDEANTPASRRPIVTVPEVATGGLYAHTSRTYRRWQSVGQQMGVTLGMNVVLGGISENAASLSPLGETTTLTGVTTPITLEIRNHGSNDINYIDLTYSVASHSATVRKTFTPALMARYNAPRTFTLTLPAIDESDIYPVSVRIDKVNGADNTDAHAEATGQIAVYGMTPQHRVLVEEYTGTWCGNCPRGMVAMEEMARRYPDDFIGVSYHNDDAMEVTKTFPTPINAYPNVMLDRIVQGDPYYGTTGVKFGLENLWKQQTEVMAPAAISVKAEWTDQTQTTIRATSEVTFPLPMQSNPYRVAYLLLADGLTGSGRAWAQSNYFRNSTENWELEGMQKFVNGDSYVLGLTYNDVMIAHSPWNGVAGSLPEQANGNVPLQHSYEFEAGSIRSLNGDELVQDKQKLRVVAVLINPETGVVVNANKAAIGAATGISAQTDLSKEMIRGYYAPDGKRLAAPRRGLNIIRHADGTTTKAIY